jgi:PAS domain S-box-containing protein
MNDIKKARETGTKPDDRPDRIGERIRRIGDAIAGVPSTIRSLVQTIRPETSSGEGPVASIEGAHVDPKQLEEYARLLALFQSTSVGLAFLDLGFRFVNMNQQFADSDGRPVDYHLGRTVADVSPEMWPRLKEPLEGVIATGRIERREVQDASTAADGAGRWWDVTYFPVRLGEEIIGVGIAVHEITQRKRAEASLRQSVSIARLFVEHAPASIAMFDNDMRCVLATRRWIGEFSREGAAVEGRSFYDIAPESPLRWKTAHQRALHGEAVSFENDRYTKSDGSVRFLNWEIRPWYEDAGGIGGLIMFSEDVTERKWLLDKLESQLTNDYELFEIAHEAILLLDLDHRIVFFNHAAQELYGWAREEALGANAHDLLKTRLPKEGLGTIDRALTERGAWAGELVQTNKSGADLVVESRWAFQNDSEHRPATILEINRDITDRRRLESKLREEEVARATDSAQREADRRLRAIFDRTNAGMSEADTTGRFTMVNARFCAIVGRSSEELLRMSIGDVTHPDDRDKDAAALRQLLAGGEPYKTTKRLVRPDGSVVWTSKVVSLSLFDGAKNIITFTVDITDEIRASERLSLLAGASDIFAKTQLVEERVFEELAHLLTEHEADTCIVATLDDHGMAHLASVSDRDPRKLAELRALLQSAPAELVGLTAALRTSEPILRSTVDRDWARLQLAPQIDRYLEERALTTALIVPLRSGDTKLGAIICTRYGKESAPFTPDDLEVVRELAGRAALAVVNARQHSVVQAQKNVAEEASRVKDDFLAMLGHELRNPLAPILTALHLMEMRDPHSHEQERTVIERQANHLVRLLDDLLDVSRITRGKVALHKTRVEMAEVVDRAVEIASPLIEQRSHQLTVCVPRHGLVVDADPERLAQVVSNLLTNAAKYTDVGGRITVSAGRADGEIQLTVNDTGMGIEASMLPNMFEMFVQERQSLDRSQGGLGLGLAIVRRLVELHGGRVRVESEGKGRGSTFTVTLPAAPERSEPDGADVHEQASEDVKAQRLSVLVIDDNVDAADTLALALRAMGHTTRTAHDAPAALEALKTFHADVALVDIGLPVMDGYELARRLRANAQTRSMCLVAVTGYGQSSDRVQSKAAGFDAHLVKPVDFKTLATVIAGSNEPKPAASR